MIKNKFDKDFTGIGSVYEKPLNPEIIIETCKESFEIAVQKISDFITQNVKFQFIWLNKTRTRINEF